MPPGRSRQGGFVGGRLDKKNMTPPQSRSVPKLTDNSIEKSVEEVQVWFEGAVENEGLKQFARDNPSIFPFAVKHAKEYGSTEEEISGLLIQAITAEYNARQAKAKCRSIVTACQQYHRTP